MRDFFVEERSAGQRVDVFSSDLEIGLTRSYAQKLIDEGLIRVNDNRTKASYRLKLEDKVSIDIPPPKKMEAKPEKLPLDIVYEDDDLIVVNKPRGMVVHPAQGNPGGTLVNALLYHCNKLSGIGGVLRPGIVHRLDKDTSGLLVVAKSDRAHQSLSKQIKERSVKRLYIALVHGRIKNDEGIIEAKMGRHPKHRKKMAVISKIMSGSSGVRSKEAITHYRVLERFKDYTLLELKLKTGRTHQIRVHMSHIGFPLVGDQTYGRNRNPFSVNGQMLHAENLGFRHPVTGKYVEFDAPPAKEFQDVIQKLRKKAF